MDLIDLITAHNTASLRFAFVASLAAEKKNLSGPDYDRASDAARKALEAVIGHVPASDYDLNIKARYLLGRIAMGETFPPEMAPALLRSIIGLQQA